MHDLRYDQEAADDRTRLRFDPTWFARSDTATVSRVVTPNGAAHALHLDPADLRTVPMPDLRSAEARELDAAVRALDTRTYDERTDARLDRMEETLRMIAVPLDLALQVAELRNENAMLRATVGELHFAVAALTRGQA